MIELKAIPRTLRIVGCFACLAISASVASAQDPKQQQQTAPVTYGSVRSYPPGYFPDHNFYWAPSGRMPEVLKPLPPGYLAPPTGEVCEDVFETPPRHMRIYSRSCGCGSRFMALMFQEKQSFHMYIRGNGPAIHSRPASILW